MNEEKFKYVCKVRETLDGLNNLKRMFDMSYQKNSISKLGKTIKFFKNLYDKEYVVYFNKLDKQTVEELAEAINTVINKRIKEIEKEYEEL